ncbi:MAG: NADP-dependent oxidoreductase [Candidatus Hydrogenedentota bacterium]|nr:MAG: NADP-dependent oxidoreductase [Candidatus Hydrogenedentota bacterium]
MSDINRIITLAARPIGFPKESDFKQIKESIPTPGENDVLIRTRYLSVDPYMRGRMNDVKSYAPPFQIGRAIDGGAVGEVVQSNNAKYAEGDIVQGNWGWMDYCLSDGAGLNKLDTSLAPMTTALGILGMPGMTAYFGFLDICDPQEGQDVFVSGAAGAVGEIVGQIAKLKGCRVVGSAGSDEKVQRLLDEAGYDAAFNYKNESEYVSTLRSLFPKGINCYFDNVGGAMTDAVLLNLAPFARISICGAISQYNLEKPEMGPRLLTMLLVTQSRAEGFIVSKFAHRFPEGITQMAQWMKEGKLTYREDVMEGLENTPKAFIRMLNGENKGKQLVEVS